MNKLLLSVLFFLCLGAFGFSQDVPAPVDAPNLTIVVGSDHYTRDLPSTLAESQSLNIQLVSLINQLVVLYTANDQQNVEKINALLTGAQKTVEAATTENKTLSQTAFARVKTFALGGYVLINPFPSIGGFNYGFGPQATLNIFNTFLLNAGVGLEIDAKDLRPQFQVSLSTWLF